MKRLANLRPGPVWKSGSPMIAVIAQKITRDHIFWRVNENDTRGPVTGNARHSLPDKLREIPRLTSIGKTSKRAGDRAGGDQRLRRKGTSPFIIVRTDCSLSMTPGTMKAFLKKESLKVEK